MTVNEVLNIRKSVYGNYSGGNYGAHCLRVDIGSVVVYFSYDTVVAIGDMNEPGPLHVSENCWSTTTGKHLNAIDGGDRDAKKRRLPRADFEKRVSEILSRYGLNIG
jgi:hypothetical protein